MVYSKKSNNIQNTKNIYYTNICPNCAESIKNKNKILKLSITNSIDFENYEKIGLIKLSVIKNCLIWSLWLYMQVIWIENIYYKNIINNKN